ncbi:MAG: hypothetical protein RL701_3991, partial [Pseudomonadota bacterium]
MPNHSMRAMGTSVMRNRPECVERTILLASGHFRYLDQGEATAPLIILAHGFPDYPKTFLPLMQRLCMAGYRCVAPFLRGYAPSILTGPFDRQRVGDDLADLAEALCPDTPVVLVGHDWGAAATYTAVSRWPQRFRRAVTLGVPHVAAFEQNLWHNRAQQQRSLYMAFFMLPGLPERLLPRNDFAYVDKLWQRWSPTYVPDVEYMREIKSCLRNSMPGPLGYYRALRPSRMREVQAELDARMSIYVPLLHLHGREDGCIAYDMAAGQSRFFKAEFHS